MELYVVLEVGVFKLEIYIDFDSTLFDTSKFYREYLNICNKNGISDEEVTLARKKLFNDNNLFNMDVITKYFIKKFDLKDKMLEEVKLLFTDEFVYDDVIPSLEKLSKKYKLILLTYGDKKYQLDKINASKLKKYFKKIIISNKSKDSLDIDYSNGIFIDNSPEEVEKFYKRNPKKVIRIRRENEEMSKKDTSIKEILEYDNFCKIVENEL